MGWRDAIAKAVLGGKVGGPTERGILTYHSSPYDFEKFALDKLKTGEGANIYGAGIYSAENPKVSGRGGEYWQNFTRHDALSPLERDTTDLLKAYNFDRSKAVADTERNIADWTQDIMKPFDSNSLKDVQRRAYAEKMLGHRGDQLDMLQNQPVIGPRTYELNLKVQPEQLLDWDKPMSAQSPYVRDVVMPMIQESHDRAMAARAAIVARNPGKAFLPLQDPEQVLGSKAYEYAGLPAANRNIGYTQSSAALNEAGVPGIRYLDAGSRPLKVSSPFPPQAQPTYNYVMFDPDKIDILAKYGVVGGAPIGMGALAAQDQYGAQQ